MLSIFSAEKSLNHPVIGSRLLNRLGMHNWRVKLADRAKRQRRHWPGADDDPAVQTMMRDGVVVLPDFLEPDALAAVQQEARSAASAAAEHHPPVLRDQDGFGEKLDRPFGFDRYDGGTLNRFIDITDAMPAIKRFARNPLLARICAGVNGLHHDPGKLQIYETYHGDEAVAHDLQKDWHRDTFFSSLKFWFFLEDVAPDDGPLCYARGSHRLSPERLAFERYKAEQQMARPHGKRTDSFRADESDLARFGLPAPQPIIVKAGTLVVADTFGLHARGTAKPGAYRLALYGWRRVNPFDIWAR